MNEEQRNTESKTSKGSRIAVENTLNEKQCDGIKKASDKDDTWLIEHFKKGYDIFQEIIRSKGKNTQTCNGG